MLKLSHITKDYAAGDSRVEALRDVSLEFRKSEFVSILGPSGCGKTTLLNIIGGLDRYTSGDLFINGISTKEYRDVDWDIYRNTSIGFIFQSYNLIPHQSVLSNVELAMTLAGISREERRRRATEALSQVGLSDQLHKKPNQLSGGQMQRVAIARALVNNPEILLADEPTGALDSETSVQIMDILRQIAKDRLVIMVTHNAELAEACSTRIIRLLDGRVISDTNPYHSEEQARALGKQGKRKKRSMSFFTALSLSMNNLLTKKTRTILTAFAGSIGIIGIALILSLSSGMNAYIDTIQKDTLSTYPIEIETQAMDLTSLMTSMMDEMTGESTEHDLDAVYSNNITTEMMTTVATQVSSNDLQHFKAYLDSEAGEEIKSLSSTIQYGYDLSPLVYASDTSDGLLQVNPSDVYEITGTSSGRGFMSGGGGSGIWGELMDNEALLSSQYDVLAGQWPDAADEIAIVVSSNNEISDMVFYALGLLDKDQLQEIVDKADKGEVVEGVETARFTYDELLEQTYRLVLQSDVYSYDAEEGVWVDRSGDEAYMTSIVEEALQLKVVGILRPNPDATAHSISGTVVYTAALADYIIDGNAGSEVVQAQLDSPDIDIFTGRPFDMDSFASSMTEEDLQTFIGMLSEDEQAQVQSMMAGMSQEQILSLMQSQMGSIGNTETATYEENLALLGAVNPDTPSVIRIYPHDFEAKERISELIEAYNADQRAAGHAEYEITYTDVVGMMISSVSSIINIISYVLIAFVSISLVVSSIMIGIITYISVLERTKEIGILRSIGASKKDISRVFTAETILVGLVAGLLGVGITMLLNIPINAIIKAIAGVSGISVLPVYGAVGLVLISVFLTFIAGLIPSRIAAKKDPVEALRTE